MSDASQLGSAASRRMPARLTITRTGDTLTAGAAIPFSLGAVLPRGIVIVVTFYILSFAWRAFGEFGRDPAVMFLPLLWLAVFVVGMLGSAWGLVMAMAGRVTVTFDRSQVTFLQEAFGLRRSKSFDLSSISAISVRTGRMPSSVSQQARFDGVMGQNRPGSCLALRRGFGTLALFPGMPEADLLSLLGQVRAHYAMLGVDLPFAQEQPAEAAGAGAAIGQARPVLPRPPVSAGDESDRGFWDTVSDALSSAATVGTASGTIQPSGTAPRSARSEPPIFASEPPSVATAPPSVASTPPSVASRPPRAPSFPAPVAVTGWRPAKRTSVLGSATTPPLSDKPVYDPEEPPR